MDNAGAVVSSTFDGVSDDITSALQDAGDEASAVFEGIASDAVSAGETGASGMESSFEEAAGGIRSTFDGVFETISENMGKVLLGSAATGAGLEVFGRKNQDLNVVLGRVARGIGLPQEGLRDLAAEASNATFPLEDVLALFEVAQQRGADSGQALLDYANFWDMVGDATGESGVALGEAGVALAALGIPLGEETEALDALGFIATQTTSDVGEFLRFVGMVGPELRDMGLGIDETAALLGAMEHELGMSGRVARSEFRKAVNESEGDLSAMLETLGLSQRTLRDYQARLAGSSASIRDNADAFAESRTPIQNMQAAAEGLLFRFPQVTEAASLMAAPLAAIGPAAIGANQAVQLFQSGIGTKMLGAIKAVTGAFGKLAAVILANPLFLIGALLIGLAVLVWKFREDIVEFITGAWEWIKDATQAFWDWLKGLVSTLVETVTGFFRNLVDTVRNLFQRWWSWYKNLWQTLFNFVRDIVRKVVDFVTGRFQAMRDTVVNAATNLRDRVVGAVQSLRDGAVERFNNLLDFVRGIPRAILDALGNVGRMLLDAGRGILQGLWDGMRQVWDNLTGWVGGLGDRIRNLKGPLAADKVLLTREGRAIIDGLGKGMEDEWDRVSQMLTGMTASIPMTVEQSAPDDLFTMGTSGRGSTLIEVTVNNPTPEPASTSITREMRRLASVGVFDD